MTHPSKGASPKSTADELEIWKCSSNLQKQEKNSQREKQGTAIECAHKKSPREKEGFDFVDKGLVGTGLDHVVAMVAVGLWGAVLGMPAVWLLPVAFPMVMAFGGLAGMVGLPLPGVETGIALSALVRGVMVMLQQRLALLVAAGLVGLCALFHGYAHGLELPDGADALLFSLAFVVATGLLHLVGIALGELARFPWGRGVQRRSGALSFSTLEARIWTRK